jgi:hypothetical protein
MIYANVILIKEGMISENYLFRGVDYDKVKRCAETKFIDLASEHVLEWFSIDYKDQEDILNDGFVMLNDVSVCLVYTDEDNIVYC